jgi:hypothetical protein
MHSQNFRQQISQLKHVIIKEQCLTWLALLARVECPEFLRKSTRRDERELAECLRPNRWAMPADVLRIQAIKSGQSCATFSSCKRIDGIYRAWSSSTDMLMSTQQCIPDHCLIKSKNNIAAPPDVRCAQREAVGAQDCAPQPRAYCNKRYDSERFFGLAAG